MADEFTWTLSLRVAAPINRLWRLMTDIHRWPTWHPLLEAVEGDLVVGGTIVTKLRSGPELTAHVLNVDLEEPHRFVYAAGDPAGLIGWHSWTLTELDPTTTRADNEERLTGPAVRNLTPDVRADIAAQQQAIATAFQNAAESDLAGPAWTTK
jgi:uncharacterized protein YndB with AHSA1/START domain